jgi:phosphopantothenoylcysteine decarboxylase/phosphopantothenate--cysteine ligase
MGFALAAAARDCGHRVALVHGPVAIAPPAGIPVSAVTSARELRAACRRLWPKYDVLIMTAAVADFTVARTAASKLKKSRTGLTLRLIPNPDILAELSRERRTGQVVIGFALEDRAARRNAAAKLRRKQLDAIVLNRPAAIGADRSAVEVLIRGGSWRRLPPASKSATARRLIRLVEELAARLRRASR